MDINEAEIAGPCRITYKGVDLGHTTGGVLLTVERDFEDVKVDRYGETPIDKVLTGNRVMVNFTLAQPNFRSLDVAIPETSSIDGTAADRIDLGTQAGASLRSEAGLLVIHPLKNADSDLSDDVNIYKAVSAENVELPMRIDEQKVVEITMHALVDETYGTGRRLGHVGPALVS